MDSARYRELFLTEARDHLVVINQALIALEHAPAEAATGAGRDSVDAIFRAVVGVVAADEFLEDVLPGLTKRQ